jgi:hypothetical protein
MCHVGSQFVGGVHTNNAGDFQWTAGVNGLNGRLKNVPPATSTDGGNVYGYACGNCHGGNSNSKTGVTFPNGSQGRGGFGSIHGTSQIIGIGTSGGASRNAYRFTNGNSMRYYDPADWIATTKQCYTLSAGTGDGWGACSKHSGGQALNETSAMQRKLQY